MREVRGIAKGKLTMCVKSEVLQKAQTMSVKSRENCVCEVSGLTKGKLCV